IAIPFLAYSARYSNYTPIPLFGSPFTIPPFCYYLFVPSAAVIGIQGWGQRIGIHRLLISSPQNFETKISCFLSPQKVCSRFHIPKSSIYSPSSSSPQSD
ncbi:hypothetical protein ES319_D10G170300v1, partial [Gossypium barbadense]